VIVLVLLSAACSMVQPASAPLGTDQNPVKLALAPTTDTQKALAAGESLTRLLEQETGLRFKLSVPTSHAAVIEAMGTNNVDVGWLSPIGYLLAHDRVGAEPLLASVRNGSTTARGQIVVRADSGITSLAGLRGTRFAFVDDSSATGSIMPHALLAANDLDPDDFFDKTLALGSRSAALLAVANRQVDGAALPESGAEARPEQVRVIARTDPVPNDTLCTRRGISPALARKIGDGLLRVSASPAGARALGDLYQIDGLGGVTDADFRPVRAAVHLLSLDLDAELAPRRGPASP
jgi:phosphonate transport system substrate-binding protein